MGTVDEVMAALGAVDADGRPLAPPPRPPSAGIPQEPPAGAQLVIERQYQADDFNARIVRDTATGHRWVETEFLGGPFPVKAWDPIPPDENTAERKRREAEALERQKRKPARYSSFAPPDPAQGGIRRVPRFEIHAEPEQAAGSDVAVMDDRWKAYSAWCEAGRPSPPKPPPAPPSEDEIRLRLRQEAARRLPMAKQGFRL